MDDSVAVHQGTMTTRNNAAASENMQRHFRWLNLADLGVVVICLLAMRSSTGSTKLGRPRSSAESRSNRLERGSFVFTL